MVQYSLIGGIYFENALVKSIQPALIENKVASCLGTFFVGNMLTGGLTKTNAFEIYLNDQLLWSTLKTERKPSTEDIVRSFRKAGVEFQG